MFVAPATAWSTTIRAMQRMQGRVMRRIQRLDKLLAIRGIFPSMYSFDSRMMVTLARPSTSVRPRPSRAAGQQRAPWSRALQARGGNLQPTSNWRNGCCGLL
ncbi:MAG: hypothetical protein ACT4P7_15685 [Gemmatimonadaceae bacterium]